MAKIDIAENRLSDLVVHEVDPSAGYARRVVALSDTSTDVPMGTVVYRTISSGQLDQDASYAVVTYGDDTKLVATNEFAVVFGDAYSAKDTFTTASSGTTDAVAFVRGEVQLKEGKVQAATGASDAQMKKLKALLEAQGVILQKAV